MISCSILINLNGMDLLDFTSHLGKVYMISQFIDAHQHFSATVLNLWADNPFLKRPFLNASKRVWRGRNAKNVGEHL